MLKLSDFNYNLPPELIAQKPVNPRDHSRLLVVNRQKKTIEHRHFFDLPEILNKNDLLVFNNTKVIPARIFGYKDTGGKIEFLLLKKVLPAQAGKGNVWETMIGGKVKDGQEVILENKFRNKKVVAKLLKRLDNQTGLVQFSLSTTDSKKYLDLHGHTPLPPYIKRDAKLERYQTVYARKEGSAAAPTAGLHFTERLLKQLKKQGVQMAEVTLHVGLGTFAPVKEDNILEHKMHSEWIGVSPSVAKKINEAKKQGKRIIAVGTTSARVLESLAKGGKLQSGKKETTIFIYPGYKWQIVNGLITNFHLPKSTLLMLVSSLAGKNLINRAYQVAVKKEYRFFSFGDAMIIM